MNIKIETQLNIDKETYDTFAEVERLMLDIDPETPLRIDQLMEVVLADQSAESVLSTVRKLSLAAQNGESNGG
jgi:hypothetical protein